MGSKPELRALVRAYLHGSLVKLMNGHARGRGVPGRCSLGDQGLGVDGKGIGVVSPLVVPMVLSGAPGPEDDANPVLVDDWPGLGVHEGHDGRGARECDAA